MYDVFDYLKWRGDLPFEQVEPNPVDMLIFSIFSYIDFGSIVPGMAGGKIALSYAAKRFLALSDRESRVRTKRDTELLELAASSGRFGPVRLAFYRNVFKAEQETQFAAITYYLSDGTAVLAFRGTDGTLVGWKEDFNMAFQESVPAQLQALRYVNEVAIHTLCPMRLVGHSKGGNLAVYAGAKISKATQERILEIHNQDGPGFTENMMQDPGYRAIVPKIVTYVPESSVVGMLLEHEEPYTVVQSKQVGPMQHDPYSWEVQRDGFIYKEEISETSKKIDRTMKAWYRSMNVEERNALVDVVYSILTSGGASTVKDALHPKQIGNYVKMLASDGKKRHTIAGRTLDLILAVLETQEMK